MSTLMTSSKPNLMSQAQADEGFNRGELLSILKWNLYFNDMPNLPGDL